MGKRRIQLKLEPKIFCVEIDDNIEGNDDILNEAFNQLAEQISSNNEMIEHIFFNNLMPVCSECGRSLNTDWEQEDFRCMQCQAELDGLHKQK